MSESVILTTEMTEFQGAVLQDLYVLFLLVAVCDFVCFLFLAAAGRSSFH